MTNHKHQIGKDDWNDDAGDCLFCGQYVESRRKEAGAPKRTVDTDPCWATQDGDYGCDQSPESSEDGCGSHFRPSQIAGLLALSDMLYQSGEKYL